MNLVCNVQLFKNGTTSPTKSGSCGPQLLGSIRTGPFTNIRGATLGSTPRVASSACDTNAIISREMNGTLYYTDTNLTTSVCLFTRPLVGPNLNSLKIGDNVTFFAGFYVWDTNTTLT